ncbi:MAG: hypothetical protein ACE5EV_06630 [Gaiellales bacterium]
MAIYHEVSELPRCGSCGKLLTAARIEEERLDHTLVFCSRQCVRIFDTYRLPKYGREALWDESVVR